MMLHSLEIPEDQSRLAEWLERHLVGSRLAELAGELRVLTPAGPAPRSSLDQRFGQWLPAAATQGLSAIPEAELPTLLAEPELLFDLQEHLFVHGGPYWQQVPRDDVVAAGVEQNWRRLAPRLEAAAPELPAVVAAPQTLKMPAPAERGRVAPRNGRRVLPWTLAIASAAAAVFFAVLYFRPAPSAPSGPGWGWAKAGALEQEASTQAYWNNLVTGAKQWFNKKPDSAPALAQRLVEFRQGCTALILAEHKPLPEKERDWLRERCRVWAVKIDQALSQLERGEMAAAQAAADDTVNQLIKALEAKAAAAS